MELMLLSGEYIVARYPADVQPELPPQSERRGLFSVTLTEDDSSIVCLREMMPSVCEIQSDGWAALRIEGVVDFRLVGVLASIIIPLGQAGVSVFTVSTYNIDYVLVKAMSLDSAVSALRGAGFVVGVE